MKKKYLIIGGVALSTVIFSNLYLSQTSTRVQEGLNSVIKQANADTENRRPLAQSGSVFCCKNTQNSSCGAASCD